MKIRYQCCQCFAWVERRTRRGIWSSCPACGGLNVVPDVATRTTLGNVIINIKQLELFGIVGMGRWST